MVEAGAQEVSEEEMIEALQIGHDAIKELCAIEEEIIAACAKPKMEVVLYAIASGESLSMSMHMVLHSVSAKLYPSRESSTDIIRLLNSASRWSIRSVLWLITAMLSKAKAMKSGQRVLRQKLKLVRSQKTDLGR
jgi:polyribonucleotide nucleotidyltransferase